ncbi:hypothetical protein MHH93_02435 [Priestia sp. FSL H7-0729]
MNYSAWKQQLEMINGHQRLRRGGIITCQSSSVHEGYSFYAIDLFNEIGSIVHGEEPEFEELTKVADHLDDFLQRIMTNSIVLE